MDLIKEITLEYLADTPIEQNFQQVLEVLTKIQENAVALAEDKEKKLTAVKTGTVLLLGILKKMSKGRMPKDFTKDDLKDLAEDVSKYAVMMDGQEYSIFIFGLYTKYIEYSVKELGTIAPEDKCGKIQELADELHAKAEQLKNGDIAEAKYTEDCLWICLDAMVKLLSTYAGCLTGQEAATLIESLSSFAFEYSRLVLYSRELALVSEYLEKQRALDEELQKRYEEYLQMLDTDTKQYSALMKDAFSKDFRKAFTGSVRLAETAGVKREEILNTQEKVDDYFLT